MENEVSKLEEVQQDIADLLEYIAAMQIRVDKEFKMLLKKYEKTDW